jgi:transcription initiation factor TFIIH subunit 2
MHDRLLKDTTPLQRGIIRHLVLILDLSSAMIEKDLRPTRYLLTLRYAREFVAEYFEQNPISQLGVIGMRDGLAVRISDISGNPNDHVSALEALREQEPKGHPSLQNALDMARAALFHAPSHGTREILLIFGSLLSSDPGDIHTTIATLVTSKISATVIGLAAHVAICRTLVSKTNPAASPDEAYGVALNEQHYRELFMRATTPPVTAKSSATAGSGADGDDGGSKSSLLMMGFPSRIVETSKSLCACHSRPSRGGYLCSRCSSKVCALPSTCPACGLTLILSTHLARSYHHLFPLKNWREVSWAKAARKREQVGCFGCGSRFPDIAGQNGAGGLLEEVRRKSGEVHKNPKGREAGVSESGRYECTTCGSFFCIDCDVFAHEVVHNCPGCLSKEISAGDGGRDGDEAPVGKGGGEYQALVDRQVERRVDKGKGKFVQR